MVSVACVTTMSDATIPLTRGMVAIVDAADYELLSQYKWQTGKGRHTYYAQRSLPRVGGKYQSKIHMHVQMMGSRPGKFVDHKNGNGLDNRRDNLRIATRRQNAQNCRHPKPNRTGFKGVTRCRSRFQARIANPAGTGLPKLHLGMFGSAEEASRAYEAAAKKLFGEFAPLPLPKPPEVKDHE